MLLLLTTLALGGAPAGIDMDDPAPWEARAKALLHGPPGCYEVVGRASWDWRVSGMVEDRGDAVFVGVLDDGEWKDIQVFPLGRVQGKPGDDGLKTYSDGLAFVPLVGRKGSWEMTLGNEGVDTRQTEPAASTDGTGNVVRDMLDELSGDTEVSWLEWDEPTNTLLLHQSMAVGDGRNPPEAVVTTRFPGGNTVPTALDVTFPPAFRLGKLARLRVQDARIQIRGQVVDGVSLPRAEAFTMKASFMGFSGTGAQTLDVRHVTRCRTAPAPPPPQ